MNFLPQRFQETKFHKGFFINGIFFVNLGCLVFLWQLYLILMSEIAQSPDHPAFVRLVGLRTGKQINPPPSAFGRLRRASKSTDQPIIKLLICISLKD
jgi:hypothetical protein